MTRANVRIATGARNGVYGIQQDFARGQAPDALWCVVDLASARGERELLAAFAQALRFPQDFGWNWDALADSLQDLSWLRPGGIVLDIRGAAALASAAPAEWAVALDILRDAATYWRKQQRMFLVFVQALDTLPTWFP